MVEPSREEEDYREAARSTADYDRYEPPQPKRRNPLWRKLGTAVAVLVAVAALAGGGYWYLKDRKSGESAQPARDSQSTAANAEKIAGTTENYNSANFNLSFDYPQDWKVDDAGNGLLTVRSPAIELLDENGQAVLSQITMTIRQKGQKVPEFDQASAATVLDSEKIAYTQPTENQRANTYLSFISFSGLAGGIDAIFVTGDSGYKKDQAVPRADIEGGDPIIGLTFAKCQNSDCTGGTTPLGISPENWDDQEFARPLKTMLQSLSVT